MKRSLPYIAILICAVVVTMILTSFKQTPQQQKVYIIRLSQTDMQIVLNSLGKQPFNDVANTYLSITQQASQQDAIPETQQPKKDSITKQNKKQ